MLSSRREWSNTILGRYYKLCLESRRGENSHWPLVGHSNATYMFNLTGWERNNTDSLVFSYTCTMISFHPVAQHFCIHFMYIYIHNITHFIKQKCLKLLKERIGTYTVSNVEFQVIFFKERSTFFHEIQLG